MEKKIRSFDGTLINYDISKNGKYYLVFVHGLGGDLSVWDIQRDFFHKKGFSTIALDIRGHGKSGRPENSTDYNLEFFAYDLNAVIKEEKISKPIIIGHCFGGMITIMFHKFFPRVASSYVLMSTTYEAPSMLTKFINIPLITYFSNYLQKSPSSIIHSHKDHSKYIGTGDWSIRRIHADIVTTSFKSWFYSFKSIAGFNGLDIVKKMDQKVLILEGEKDSIFPLSVARKIHYLIKKSDLKVIRGANHVITVNNPLDIANDIYEFLCDEEIVKLAKKQ